MRPLTLIDIKNLHEYEKVRKQFRTRVIDHKKPRRVRVGDVVTFVFEDRLTLTFQVQEMVRAERIVDEDKVQGELDTYNELIPADDELSATMFIEVDDEEGVSRWLSRLSQIEHSVSLDFGDGVVIHGIAEGGRSRSDRTASVHYLKFKLTDEAWLRLGATPEVRLRIEHPQYRHEAVLSSETRESLLADRGQRGPQRD